MPVAPHENNEVRLVLGGHKPLAAIERAKDPIGYSLAIALAGTGALAIHILRGEVLITKPSNHALIEEYLHLLSNGVKLYGIKEYHARMGAIFGYTPQDVRDFIEAEIECNCTKCKGF